MVLEGGARLLSFPVAGRSTKTIDQTYAARHKITAVRGYSITSVALPRAIYSMDSKQLILCCIVTLWFSLTNNIGNVEGKVSNKINLAS